MLFFRHATYMLSFHPYIIGKMNEISVILNQHSWTRMTGRMTNFESFSHRYSKVQLVKNFHIMTAWQWPA